MKFATGLIMITLGWILIGIALFIGPAFHFHLWWVLVLVGIALNIIPFASKITD